MKTKKINDYLFEIPKTEKPGMQVPARIYASEKLMNQMDEGVFKQVTNVACLPGIQNYAYCMPDGHWGYGFPIGGVAAFDLQEGVISPGGIGFDINCGMRLIRTNLHLKDVKPKLDDLINELYRQVPAGVGSKGIVKLSKKEFRSVMKKGVSWCLEKGYGWAEDSEYVEESGALEGADPDAVSQRAYERGLNQLGTLGSGNHYLEIQTLREGDIFNSETARAFGIEEPGQIFVMFHCGSRGFGHQIGTDYLKLFTKVMPRYGLKLLEKELACAPANSPEGKRYYGAMAAAANNAFANRQLIMHRIRESFARIFGKSAESLGMNLVYDVAHNIAKKENYNIKGRPVTLLVHRKGATRAFGPGSNEIPEKYRPYGQPVIVGGSMQTGSYLLAGTEEAVKTTFGSSLHGSGRTMSRVKARKRIHGRDLLNQMNQEGIKVKAVSMRGLAEEAGFAYKDIEEVVKVVHNAGLSKKVAKLRPIANIKG